MGVLIRAYCYMRLQGVEGFREISENAILGANYMKARLTPLFPKKRLKLDDAIEWTGFTSDVRSQLARMDLFVLPSLFGEGLPMVVLEAMAAGVPIVGTRVEGVPEAIRDGEDGLLAEPSDPIDLARVLAGVSIDRQQ